MNEIHVEGVVLKNTKYSEYDCILSLFTKEEGLISLFVKGGNQQKKGLHALCSPLTHAEFTYKPNRRGNLNFFVEGHTIKNSHELRNDYNCLEAACSIAQALTKSQFPHKAAPQLYALLLYYLQRLPQTNDPQTLVDSFRLKLLIHEGLVGLSPSCTQCENTWQTVHFADGEWFCGAHAPAQYVLRFDQECFSYTMQVATGRSFKEISSIKRPKEASELIERMFSSQVQVN